MSKVSNIPPESLVLDYCLYPRHQIDPTNVTNITRAREAGIELPPVVAWSKNNKVTDGFHRVTDALRNKLKTISALLKDYPDEAAALEDAFLLNAHGKQLSSYDKARCIQLAANVGLEPERLAHALGMTMEKLENLKIRKTAIDPNVGIIPIKATLRNFAGEKLEQKQVKGNQVAGGMSQVFYVNQVTNLIENKLVDRTDEKLMTKLAELYEKLKLFFASKKKVG